MKLKWIGVAGRWLVNLPFIRGLIKVLKVIGRFIIRNGWLLYASAGMIFCLGFFIFDIHQVINGENLILASFGALIQGLVFLEMLYFFIREIIKRVLLKMLSRFGEQVIIEETIKRHFADLRN